MPEIKHTFQGGKMNKDLDERLVPNGEFRDAENIQVRTSESDAIGTVQNIKGTAEIGASYLDSTWMLESEPNTMPIAVASVADEKTNKGYFFFASPPVPTLQTIQLGEATDLVASEMVFIDSIVEQDINGNTAPVVIDRHAVINTFEEVLPDTIYDSSNYVGGWTSFQVADASKYRVGMTIKALAPSNLAPFQGQLVNLFTNYVTEGGTITMESDWGNGAKIKAIDLATNTITLYEEQFTNLDGVVYFVFEAERVLNFQGNTITGINVIDDLLFWTDNLTEPKKINITRSKEGSVDFETHTKLHVEHPLLSTGPGDENYVSISTVNPGLTEYPVNEDLQERHITVMRQSPRTAPTLEMSDTLRTTNITAEFDWEFTDGTASFPAPEEDDEIIITSSTFLNTDWKLGDRLDITLLDLGGGVVEEGSITVSFISYVDAAGVEVDGPTNSIKLEVSSVIPVIPSGTHEWEIKMKQKKPLFELKLARFGYRYKYEDGEYSAFSPWSELAFLPGEFDMVIKKAYNLGMVNTVRELIVKDFIPYKKPMDIVAVDLLYKESSKPNVYVVKTIERTKDDDWELNSPSLINTDEIKTGRLNITSEMIHKVLPSNQTLRAWDSVPRYALAQEITANRLVYGNYVQGYPFNTPVTLNQLLISDTTATLENPQKSVKSIRHYKWGMVFGDKYGRETPVIESGRTDANNDQLESMSGDIVVEKYLSSFKNHFELQQGWSSISVPNGVPPDWIDYVKYYVKETSNEYYNMVMDRWYWADEEKDNVWVAFNSADRNKIDDETYLIVKNQHGNHTAVTDKARFKIIAIENDAPDFIKTVRRPIGKVKIYPRIMNKQSVGVTSVGSLPAVATDPNNTGWGLIGNIWNEDIPADMPEGLCMNTTCQIEMSGWNETISGWAAVEGSSDPVEFAVQDFSNSIFGRRIQGNIKMRIYGEDNSGNRIYTAWRSLYHYRFVDNPEDPPTINTAGDTLGGGAGGASEWFHQKIELNWDSSWGEEAWMYERFLEAYGVTDIDMYIEFVEDDIDHRPQFDGRFFVKLERNLELETHVLYAEGSGGVYFNARVDQYFALGPTSLGVCGNNIDTSDFWHNWTYPAYTLSAKGPALFVDRFQPFHARFNNVPDGSAIDPDDPAWNTVSELYGDGGMTWTGGFQGYPGVTGLARMYISAQVWPPDDGAYVDEDNDGLVDGYVAVDGSFFPNYLYAGWSIPNSMLTGLNASVTEPILNLLTTVGTMFRFAADPFQIFEVIDAEWAVGSDGGHPQNYGGVQENTDVLADPMTMDYVANSPECTPCGLASNDVGACRRRMIRVDFRLVNQDNNSPIYTQGLTGFDPTSGVGSSDDGKIYIVKPSDVFGSPGIRHELGGCWETEPKDDVDLELYYEASNAIPMVLNEQNAFDFAPINSKVSIRRWSTQQDDEGNDIQVLTDAPLTNSNHRVANIEFLTDETPLIQITSEDSDGNIVPHVYDIQTDPVNQDEFIVFTHPDGTQTMSTVIGEYEPGADPSNTAISNGSGSVPFVESEVIYREIAMINPSTTGMYISNAEGLQVGDYIWSINSTIFQENESYNADPIANGVYDMSGQVFTYPPVSSEPLVGNTSIIPNGYVITSITPSATYWNPTNDNDLYNGFADEDNPGVNITIGTIDADGNVTPTNPSTDPNWQLFMLDWYQFQLGNYGITDSWPYQFTVRVTSFKGYYEIDPNVWKYKIKLAWHNCYSFGNGVESDRIRDDFNALQIDNGVRVSTTFSGYGVEHKSSGLIHSGLYNSTSEVNNLNEFNMGEKILKDLNPIYGSIQALKTRDTDVVIFAEDKVLRVIANKDAVYNADGNPQLIATNRTLGQVLPYGGDYGISQNPESLAVDQYRMYFTDKQRGTVCRLSMDGITPISHAGMKNWFRENLSLCSSLVGSFDDVNGEYNITLKYDPARNPIIPEESDNVGVTIENWPNEAKTVSFNEGAKGWSSFKSFIPQTGTSISGKYITARNNKIWEHYRDLADDGTTPIAYNNFYGTQYESRFTVMFNDMPSVVKHFNTINYEGTQSFVTQNLLDNEFYNLTAKEGWYVNKFDTDLQSGFVNEFIDKENKWFNRIQGEATTLKNIDTNEFTVQGIGVPTVISGDYEAPGFIFTVQNWEDDIDESTDTWSPEFNSVSSTYEG